MSESTSKRVKVPKPEKKKSSTTSAVSSDHSSANDTTATTTTTTDDALINIPAIKKKKERHVKTETDIAAKQERKKLRKEAEQLKKEAQLAKKGLVAQKTAIQNKTPKWKQFLKNTTEADNAEQLKDTTYKVKGDDGSDEEEDGSDSDDDTKEKNKKSKRKADKQAEVGSSKSKKSKSKHENNAALTALDTSTPGLAYLVEWKRSKDTWKFQKLRQVWLLNHMYDDKEIPSTHWNIFLDYIHDLKGAARNSTIQDAKKIVEAPEPEDSKEDEEKENGTTEDKGEDEEMKDASTEDSTVSTIPLSEEEKAAEEAAEQAKVEAKRAAEVKASRALDVLRVLA
ncbi:hypothetical protein BC939DRAFT_468537 [Gamsiella multidivaricata]|uniref:uncharacterized protein n=1 Tax=Gamsiella multidivaricata TaxID=101098 RepID=UPI00221FAC20|nr:uncharacterized protein BC939DRAFT_468537 [Gamsiella multidivaricata]KAI7816590.1 hypothetical protein BC939DRAFT_468537 [Gamsiella multidivaricata]